MMLKFFIQTDLCEIEDITSSIFDFKEFFYLKKLAKG